ncbi:MAG TPA: ATP-binding protein [Gemmatimonadaceae bacterium]|nr:ATP-binding protein [Gemmatimonadaceae bacterium]
MAVTKSISSVELGHLTSQLARFEALFEAVPLAIAMFDEALRLARANTRYYELVNLDPAHAAARSIYDAFPNALADLTESIDGAIAGTPSPPRRFALQQRQGGQRIVEATFTPVPKEYGVRGVLFVAGDVSEREQLREELARSVAQLESIFAVIPDSVRVFDHEGMIIHSNTQARQDHDAQPETLSELWKLDRPKTLDGTTLFMHEHPTARALKGETVHGTTLAVRRGGGNAVQVLEISANPLRDPQGKIRGAVTVERDVTERTRLAQELAEQVRRSAELYERVSTEAERLERMVEERTRELLALQEARSRERRLTAVGQLAAGVMHDVNNALNPIMAAAYLLDVNATDPAAVRDYAGRIAKAAETGAATAARVGRFIRQEPLKDEREELVDLSAVADEVVAMTRPLWAERARGGRVRLERVLGEGVLIRGIAGELREAMLNLVQNALDAMQAGGTLGIVTRVHDGQASIEVSDSGLGMTDEVRERAFEPFFSTKGARGTGLGLSEVYGIVKRHRGQAEIVSSPGSGTLVRLTFPHDASALPPPAPNAQRRLAKRVLLVEDNNDGREFMQALLESDGHTVVAVSSLEQALARLDEGDAYDVVVTDIGLPDGSGWDLVDIIRQRRPGLRVGVVTGWEVRTGPANGADFTLRKPVKTLELLECIGGRLADPPDRLS